MPERKLGSKFIKRFLKTSEDEIYKKKKTEIILMKKILKTLFKMGKKITGKRRSIRRRRMCRKDVEVGSTGMTETALLVLTMMLLFSLNIPLLLSYMH